MGMLSEKHQIQKVCKNYFEMTYNMPSFKGHSARV